MTDVLAELTADGGLVTERLVHFARETPDKLCFLYGEEGTRLTYREFADRTGSLAANLRANGIAKGDRVSVFCFDPLLSALAMFAIWRAGAVFCPVNFSYTGRLLSYQLNDTRPTLLVTEERMLPTLDAVWGELVRPPERLVYRSRDWDALLRPSPPPAPEVSWHDVANVFYTSGTTGPSKGVVQLHRWMTQYTFRGRRFTTPVDVIYNDLPLYHVGGAIGNVVRALWAGAAVACWDRFSPTEFWSRIERCGASQAMLLDVMVPWLMNADPMSRDRENTLKHALMQPLPQHHHAVATRFGFDFVSCGFGQTESGNPLAAVLEECEEGQGTPLELYKGLTHAQVREVARRLGVPLRRGEEVTRKGFMGTPNLFVDAAVLDEHDDECRPGEPGQLCFRPRAAGLVLREYLGKPEATVDAFRNLWFHTGDVAIRDEEGDFYFVDRLGDRIRVRGENLSSFQVEDVVNGHPDVEFCAVFPIRAAEGDEDDIVLYVVPRNGAAVTPEALTGWAEAELPKFMRPRHVRVVDDIPRTPTNKVEKYRLRQRILAELGRS